uniref:Uncharacterized protein n=1 Tax=viral metagenome TaxID=1070528 RepID=A0A6C0CAF5_9ZZZZ
MTSWSSDALKYKPIFHEKIHIDKIINLQHFDNFECIELFKVSDTYPKCVKYIYFEATFKDLSLNLKKLKKNHIGIPMYIT